MRKYIVRLLKMLCIILCVALNGCNKNYKNPDSEEEMVVQSQTVEVQAIGQSK